MTSGHPDCLDFLFVSCPAGGNNNGLSGGRKIFFFLTYIFSPCIEMVEKMLGKKRKIRKCEKNVPTRHLKSHPAGGQETN